MKIEIQNLRLRRRPLRAAKSKIPGSAGFTLTEIVVITSIITTVSATVLVSFGGLNDGVALNRAAREFALALRQAQSTALGVTAAGSSAVIPPYAGVRVSTVSSVEA